jgi:hypothetical protein
VQEVIEYLNGFEPKMTMQLMRETGRTLRAPGAKRTS